MNTQKRKISSSINNFDRDNVVLKINDDNVVVSSIRCDKWLNENFQSNKDT